jgi:hypothetical protein
MKTNILKLYILYLPAGRELVIRTYYQKEINLFKCHGVLLWPVRVAIRMNFLNIPLFIENINIT